MCRLNLEVSRYGMVWCAQTKNAPPTLLFSCINIARYIYLIIWILKLFSSSSGVLMTWWQWTAGSMLLVEMTAAPAWTPSRSTTRAATSGWQHRVCSHAAAASEWPFWSCSTSRHPPRPHSLSPPPAFDKGWRPGWAPAACPAWPRGATAQCELLWKRSSPWTRAQMKRGKTGRVKYEKRRPHTSALVTPHLLPQCLKVQRPSAILKSLVHDVYCNVSICFLGEKSHDIAIIYKNENFN